MKVLQNLLFVQNFGRNKQKLSLLFISVGRVFDFY